MVIHPASTTHQQLSDAEQRQAGVRTDLWGTLAPAADNAIVVCHALTGSADADRWWAPLFGQGRVLDPERDFILCSNDRDGDYDPRDPPVTGLAAARAIAMATYRSPRSLASLIPNATWLSIDSAHGHDGFLIDADRFQSGLLAFKSRQAIDHALPGRRTSIQPPGLRPHRHPPLNRAWG